jgi:type VI protein secretion system component Hcp
MDLYMRITNPDIRGDSRAKSFANEFELYSLSYSAVNAGGRATITPITVTLAAYNGPLLIAGVFDGRSHDVRFSIVKPSTSTGAPTVFETITLSKATITSFREIANAGDDRPTLELSFAYQGLKYVQIDNQSTFTYPATA